MRIPSRLGRQFASFRSLTQVALGLTVGVLPAIANASPAPGALRVAQTLLTLDINKPGEQLTGRVCNGRWHCNAHVHATADGHIKSFVTPQGFGAADLQSAYNIPAKPVSGTPTIAIIDAFGYTNLESDLASYRTQMGLPACSTANGCLQILDETGGTALPAESTDPTDDWTVETALDVDMASAGCPGCNIVVIQADSDQTMGLFIANNLPSTIGATTISNSWGGPEQAAQPATSLESFFNHPGAAIFVSAGDDGFDTGGQGPGYPATSQFVISVGGTHLVQDTSGSRGWSESAWSTASGNGAGGSACSLSIPQPAYQASLNTTCANKATSDISAVADPQTGVAVFNKGSWIVVGGTSASSPLIASIWAATGNGANTSGAYVASIASKLHDVTSGSNGTCGNILCNAGVGWDGPTGFGTPDAGALVVGGGSGAGDGGDGTGGGGGAGNPPIPGETNDVIGGCAAAGGSGGLTLVLLIGGAMLISKKKR